MEIQEKRKGGSAEWELPFSLHYYFFMPRLFENREFVFYKDSNSSNNSLKRDRAF